MDIRWVQSDEEWDELYTAVHSVPLKMSPLESYGALGTVRNSPKINFFNVYYENVLIGYMFLDHKTPTTVEFHWGVVNKHKYLMSIIRQSFKACQMMGIKNFIGTIPVENHLSMKIAKKMRFNLLTVLNNYFEDGGAVFLVNYEVK
jgi:hypothetical protein